MNRSQPKPFLISTIDYTGPHIISTTSNPSCSFSITIPNNLITFNNQTECRKNGFKMKVKK